MKSLWESSLWCTSWSAIDAPFSSDCIKNFNTSGVYMFSQLAKNEISEILQGNLKDVDLKALQIIYVGKAKSLTQRLRCYRGKLRHLDDDGEKAHGIRRGARSVVVLPFSSHFEACLYEIALIREASPVYNKRSKRSARITFLGWEENSLVLCSHFPSGKLVGFFNKRRKARQVLAVGQYVEEYLKTGSFKLPVADITSFAKNKLTFSVASAGVLSFLLSQEKTLLEKIWADMLSAAAEERFRHAAGLKEFHVMLQKVQSQLKTSRNFCLKYANLEFSFDTTEGRKAFRLENFVPVNSAGLKIGVMPGNTSVDDKLGSHYEVLRLIRHWKNKKLEGFRISSTIRKEKEIAMSMGSSWLPAQKPAPRIKKPSQIHVGRREGRGPVKKDKEQEEKVSETQDAE